MLKSMFVNACILISFMFLSSQVFRNTGISHKSSLRLKALAGLLAGFLGCILMYFSSILSSTVILDLRQIPIIVVSFFGGLFSAMVTGLILAFFRIAFFGISTSAVIGAVSILLTALGCGFISGREISPNKKWIYMFIYSIALACTSLYIAIWDFNSYMTIIYYYLSATLTVGFLAYLMAQYLIKSYQMLQKLKQEATKDFLTGLNNVRSFDKEFNAVISDIKTKNEKLSMLYIDLDFFKKVNDTYGHKSGDFVLKELGTILQEACRQGDIVSRVGGEEFSILLPYCTSEKALEVAERIRMAVQYHTFVLPDGRKLKVTVSIGIATYPDTVSNIDQLMSRADSALYDAKHSGRNKISFG